MCPKKEAFLTPFQAIFRQKGPKNRVFAGHLARFWPPGGGGKIEMQISNFLKQKIGSGYTQKCVQKRGFLTPFQAIFRQKGPKNRVFAGHLARFWPPGGGGKIEVQISSFLKQKIGSGYTQQSEQKEAFFPFQAIFRQKGLKLGFCGQLAI